MEANLKNPKVPGGVYWAGVLLYGSEPEFASRFETEQYGMVNKASCSCCACVCDLVLNYLHCFVNLQLNGLFVLTARTYRHFHCADALFSLRSCRSSL